jgi:NADPH:quinone reductase-like Zn-dependent oxidoreductase
MNAAFFRQHGGPEVMEYGEVPDPFVRSGEVLVDVHAASVNGADWKVRSGRYAPLSPLSTLPHIPGRDFSGVVAELGTGVGDLQVGDPVFGVCDVGREGAYAEKVAIGAAIVARKPERQSHGECAAIALTGLTALVAIEDTLKLKTGESLLVQGGAGGVASFAIQIAKHLGARVTTTTSAANMDYVRRLGADEVIDYQVRDFTTILSNLDAVFDTVGGDVATRSFAVLRPGGRAAFIASGNSAPPSPRPDVVALRPDVRRDRAHLERVADLVTRGVVRVPEITTYPLARAAEAHRVSEGRHLRGKLVFAVR